MGCSSRREVLVYIAKHFESITRISCDLETRRASQQSILMGTLGREKDVVVGIGGAPCAPFLCYFT